MGSVSCVLQWVYLLACCCFWQRHDFVLIKVVLFQEIWNLRLEMQKYQGEKLEWKEKYLDLCIVKNTGNLMVSTYNDLV